MYVCMLTIVPGQVGVGALLLHWLSGYSQVVNTQLSAVNDLSWNGYGSFAEHMHTYASHVICLMSAFIGWPIGTCIPWHVMACIYIHGMIYINKELLPERNSFFFMIPPSRPGLLWGVPGGSEGVEAGTWNGSAQPLKYVGNGVIGFESVLNSC